MKSMQRGSTISCTHIFEKVSKFMSTGKKKEAYWVCSDSDESPRHQKSYCFVWYLVVLIPDNSLLEDLKACCSPKHTCTSNNNNNILVAIFNACKCLPLPMVT